MQYAPVSMLVRGRDYWTWTNLRMYKIPNLLTCLGVKDFGGSEG